MTDHIIAARKALGNIPNAADEARHTALGSEATAHAVLALVEQQRLANAIAAYSLCDWDSNPVFDNAESAAIEAYIRDQINHITNSRTTGATS